MAGKLFLCLLSALFGWAIFVEVSYTAFPRPLAIFMGAATFGGMMWFFSEKRDSSF